MMNRHDNRLKPKRKKGKIKRLLLIVFIFMVAFACYISFQYYQGLKSAGTSSITNEAAADFNGAKLKKLGKVNILLLGVDSRGEEKSRTDTIMVAQYDLKNNKAKVVSIMRDIYVEIPGYKNYKINTAYFLGGPELLRQTLEYNLGIDLHYYVLVDFKGFEKVVDTLAPRGIEINVEKRMSEKIGVILEPGLQRLNGKELLGYVRFRHDAAGDFGRVKRQQKVLNALKDEILSFNGAAKLPKLMGTIQPYIETNMNSIDQLSILKDFVLHTPEEIETLRIPVNNSYTNTFYQHTGEVLEIDMKKNKQALYEFLSDDSTYTQEKSSNSSTKES
jgi:polyisoprenyl-teichoic acid--peptidoglycan teichoic acid transferase